MEVLRPNFSGTDELVTAVIQDSKTRVVLAVAYMNRDALMETVAHNRLTLFLTSTKKVEVYGRMTGNFQEIYDIRVSRDGKSVLVLARPAGSKEEYGLDDLVLTDFSRSIFIEMLHLGHLKAGEEVILTWVDYPVDDLVGPVDKSP